jgi:hypothetical protein
MKGIRLCVLVLVCQACSAGPEFRSEPIDGTVSTAGTSTLKTEESSTLTTGGSEGTTGGGSSWAAGGRLGYGSGGGAEMPDSGSFATGGAATDATGGTASVSTTIIDGVVVYQAEAGQAPPCYCAVHCQQAGAWYCAESYKAAFDAGAQYCWGGCAGVQGPPYNCWSC